MDEKFKGISPYLKIVIDTETIEEYNQIYFNVHKRAHKKPFETPMHPSVNEWAIQFHYLKRNEVREHWHAIIRMILNKFGYDKPPLKKAKIKINYFFKSKRKRDASNWVAKFLEDALVVNHVIEDDNYEVIGQPEVDPSGYDPENPRMEVYIYPLRE